MAVRSCHVTLVAEGVNRSVLVTANSLYEAVALGIRAVRGDELADQYGEGTKEIKVTVCAVPVEHTITMAQFTKWLNGSVKSPKDVTERQRIREILET